MKKFNIDAYGTFKVRIGGIETEVINDQSDNRLDGINLIGDRFLRDAGAKLEVDYKAEPQVQAILNLQNWKQTSS